MKKLLLILLFVAAAGCSSGAPDDELIAETLDSLEQAAQARDVGEFMEWVSKEYADDSGNDWKRIRGLAQYQFIQNRKLYLYKSIRNMDIVGDQATAIVLVAAAGEPISDPEKLTSIKAELMRFDLELVRDKNWTVKSATWRRINASDFLL
ncbi:MAG: hypothetical protein AAF353_00400 [Pseudomonadota bacterium]